MRSEQHTKNEIPDLNASDEEWKKYWNSCSIGEIVSILEKLIQTDIKKKPIENKFHYIRAVECKEVLSITVHELIDKNNKLIEDIELGRN